MPSPLASACGVPKPGIGSWPASMPAVVAARMAGSRACDGSHALLDVHRRGRVDGAAGTFLGVEGRRAAGAAPGGRGAAAAEPPAEAGVGGSGGARRPDPATPGVGADEPAGDAGYVAELASAAGPLAVDLSSPGRTTTGR